MITAFTSESCPIPLRLSFSSDNNGEDKALAGGLSIVIVALLCFTFTDYTPMVSSFPYNIFLFEYASCYLCMFFLLFSLNCKTLRFPLPPCKSSIKHSKDHLSYQLTIDIIANR